MLFCHYVKRTDIFTTKIVCFFQHFFVFCIFTAENCGWVILILFMNFFHIHIVFSLVWLCDDNSFTFWFFFFFLYIFIHLILGILGYEKNNYLFCELTFTLNLWWLHSEIHELNYSVLWVWCVVSTMSVLVLVLIKLSFVLMLQTIIKIEIMFSEVNVN